MAKRGRAGWTNYGDEEIPVGPRVSAYPLHTKEWREAFLSRLVDVGYVALDEAAAHVYDLIAGDKGYHCALVGQLAGVDGAAEATLKDTLRQFLDEWLRFCPIEHPSRFGSIDDWHNSAMATWADEREREAAVVVKYATWLNGQSAQMQTDTGKVLHGPWRSQSSADGAPITRFADCLTARVVGTVGDRCRHLKKTLK